METCPRITKDHLLEQLSALGLEKGDTVMVHASMRAVGEILGGPDVLIDAILKTIGTTGTMMVYLGCQAPYDDVGRGLYSEADEQFIMQNCPPFDSYKSRASRDFGALAECFRTRDNVRCSDNVGARMAAVGAKASELTKEHQLNYGLGKKSPLERLCNLGGKLLLIGSDLDNVTMLHYAEAIAPIEGKRLVHIKVPLLADGRVQWIEVEEFDSSKGIKDWPDDIFSTILKRYFSETSDYKQGPVGAAHTYLVPAQNLVEFAVAIMVQTAAQLDTNHTVD